MALNLTNNKTCKTCKYAEILGDNVSCASTDSLKYSNFERDGIYCAVYCNGYSQTKDAKRVGFIEQSKALNYILAGNSEFILHSTKTNQDFKFAVVRKKSRNDKSEYIYFINVLSGNSKIYAGFMVLDNNTQTFRYIKGTSGNIEETDLGIKSLIFVVNKLFRADPKDGNNIVQNLEVYHTGKCGYCGRKLTTLESIYTGIGPKCSEKLGIPRIKM